MAVRIALDPQPKHGKPFQIRGDATKRFYNAAPIPSRSLFSYVWRVPKPLGPDSVRIEKRDGIYEWVADEPETGGGKP